MKNKPKNNYRKFSNNSSKISESKNYSKTKNPNKLREFKDTEHNFRNNNYSKTKNPHKLREFKDTQHNYRNNNYRDYQNENSYNSNDKFKNNFKNLNENKFSNNEYKDSNLEDFIWGKHSVLSTLESKRPINRIWCTTEIKTSEKFFITLKDLKRKGVLVEEVSWSRISQITRGAVHQGIALQVSHSQIISLDKLISSSKNIKTSPVLICLDGITDPHNLGAIIRSAEAFGCFGVILPQRRSAGITGTVAKVAAGALEHIAVTRVVNLNRTLQTLKNEGFLVVGLTEKANLSLSKFKEKAPMVIVVGSENKGISLITQKYCDYLLRIPLKGKTSSLNASVAAGIFINHITKIY